jgi:hypothetical protein
MRDAGPIRAALRDVARAALAASFLAWLLAASIHPALAESPSPSPGTYSGGDTRTAGQGPGLEGSPLYAIGGVVVVALVSIGITLIYLRTTSGAAAAPDSSPPDDSETR